MIKKIGILTSGGDAPGMNPAIRAATRTALAKNIDVAFIYNGYAGILNDEIKDNISNKDVGDIINRGGSILGSSRYPEFKAKEVRKKAVSILKSYGIEALIVIGGDGSFKGANLLKPFGIKFIGIPGTIDNDIAGTDETLGFDTCLNTITEAIDNIRDTSSSHHRCIIIETMGRECGDLAIYSGLAGGCDIILPPGDKIDYASIYDTVKTRKLLKKSHTLIIITEMQTDIFEMAKKIQSNTGIDTRATRLGFIQRGGRPSFRDRFLGTIMGYKSIEFLSNDIYNVFVGINGDKITHYSIDNINELTNKSSNYLIEISKVIN